MMKAIIKPVVSLTQVAREAGVSLTTASLVLNPGKQPSRISTTVAQRVRQTAQSLGYVANYHARSMKLGRSDTLAVTIDVGAAGASITTLAVGYFAHLAAGVELAARQRGYTLAMVSPSERGSALERTLHGIRQKRFDAGVILGKVLRPEHMPLVAQPTDQPVVLIEYGQATPWPVIDWDEPAAVRIAVAHLADLGHRDLLWLGVAHPDRRDAVGDRERMFIQSTWELGLRGSSLRFAPSPKGDTGMLEAAEAAMHGYLQTHEKPPWTAIVAYNDKLAIAACRALQAHGLRVPQDVSVIGFDDLEAALGSPPITTVSQKLLDLGRRASELAIEFAHDPGAIARARGTRQVIPPELITRSSTGPAPERHT